jgi:hypothetical protein
MEMENLNQTKKKFEKMEENLLDNINLYPVTKI